MVTDGDRGARPLRILVIDDVACYGKDGLSAIGIQAAIRNYFAALVVAPRSRLIVDFVGTPEEGVRRWQNGVYDLTLVDSDFHNTKSAEKKKADDSQKCSFLDLDVEFVGAYLYRFLHEMLAKDQGRQDGGFRQGCKVVLWTGLTCEDADQEKGQKKKGRAERIFDVLGLTLENSASSCPIEFVPKNEDNVTAWRKVLAGKWEEVDKKEKAECENKAEQCVTTIEHVIQCVGSLEDCGERSMLARALTWYKTMSPKDFARAAGLNEPFSEGYLSWRNGAFNVSWDCPKNGIWVNLSPRLRTRGSFAECIKDYFEINKESVPAEKDTTASGKTGTTEKSTSKGADGGKITVIAAATPLTGCSAVGRSNALKVMQQKIGALLDKAFDRVVLKTVYLNNLDKDERDEIGELAWPELQIQSLHRARCYRSAAHPRTLWNTGTTAQEAFSPEMMNEFLKACVHGSTIPAERIIVSLGSKFPDDEQRKIKTCESLENRLRVVWSKLFSTVFQDLKGKHYTDVEINVRHYLRGCINANLGGDEYLSPTTVPASGAVFGNYQAVDEEFKQWLSVVNDVALEHGKHLYLKMPFRGDLIHFIGLIMAVKKEKGESKNAIKGLVFVNAFKSALNEPEKPAQYSPAWYGSTKSWNDQKGDVAHAPLSMRCQVSGELLQLSRNQLLFAVAKAAADAGLGLQIGGGVVDQEDLLFCSKFSRPADKTKDPQSDADETVQLPAVQIGTWGLMDLKLDSYLGNCGKLEAAVPSGNRRNCQANEANLQPSGEGFSPRIAFCLHELCNGCGKCSRSFYCDTFLDRRGRDLPPVMDARNCTGCGLCAQICPNGAIQLFRPEDMVMLIAESKDILLTWHRRLDACEIPHLCYEAQAICDLAKQKQCAEDSLIGKWNALCQAEARHLQNSIVLYVENETVLQGGRTVGNKRATKVEICPLTWEWKNGVGRLLSKDGPDDWLKDIKREVAKRLNAMRR